jgi:hypothetical protein
MADQVPRLRLNVIPYGLAICRLASSEWLPAWVTASRFLSVTRTDTELSIVCEEACVPPSVISEPGWQALEIAGPLDFNLTGILSSLLTPLAKASISIFAISTFDTDYVLVKTHRINEAVAVLRAASHQINGI